MCLHRLPSTRELHTELHIEIGESHTELAESHTEIAELHTELHAEIAALVCDAQALSAQFALHCITLYTLPMGNTLYSIVV